MLKFSNLTVNVKFLNNVEFDMMKTLLNCYFPGSLIMYMYALCTNLQSGLNTVNHWPLQILLRAL